MSFFEDNVADGSHCSQCLCYIGADVGYTRECSDCKKDNNSATQKAPKRRKHRRNVPKKGPIVCQGDTVSGRPDTVN